MGADRSCLSPGHATGALKPALAPPGKLQMASVVLEAAHQRGGEELWEKKEIRTEKPSEGKASPPHTQYNPETSPG